MTIFQRCNVCGENLQVPAEAHSVKCNSCLTTNLVHANSGVQTERSIVQTAAGNYHGYHTMNRLPTSPSFNGRKRAVLCGVSYKFTRNELKDSADGVNCMRVLLRNKFGFPDDCILVLSEDEKNPDRTPTKQNIRNAMRWLVLGCLPGDSLVFHFLGHGSQQIDCSGDEADGYDEALCPMDYETQGNIIDDEINETIVRPLPRGAKLHAIIDASHSGTALDLPFVCRMGRTGSYQWVNQSPACSYKGTSGGMAVSFSSCNDNQTSMGASAYQVKNTTGAMTCCFIEALEREPKATYGRLLNAMRTASKEMKAGAQTRNPIYALVRKVLTSGVTAEPQLCASEKFDTQKLVLVL
ncbi:metacaspase-1-like [Aristolochia californica]|uniref:metacaspase-1-like n=1 Tax=Aristolochia californica TaxID=171875 RepID=UPI0035D994C4